jgi:predicted NUDIX family phosphoesterase
VPNGTGENQHRVTPESSSHELVLVIPRAVVPGGCDFTGVRPGDAAELIEIGRAVRSHGAYVPRPEAEVDPSRKQLIPYVVVRDAEQIFLMERTRAGADPRLHLKASIGVGGHLNPVDRGDDPLMGGLRREWSEELVADFEPTFNLVGLLNDDSNPVGSVHLGVVFTVEADGAAVAVREHDKLTGRFARTDEVLGAWDRMETWSQLVAAHLLGIDP